MSSISIIQVPRLIHHQTPEWQISDRGYKHKEKKERLGNNSNQKPPTAVRHVLEIVEACCKLNDSCLLLFIVNFFRKCNEKGRFSFIIDHFMKTILPNAHISH